MNKTTKDTIRLRQTIADNKPALEKIFDEYQVKNPRIFGSVAHGNATKTSDIDILIDGYNPKIGLLGEMRLINQLQKILGTSVDLVEANLIKENRRHSILNGTLLSI